MIYKIEKGIPIGKVEQIEDKIEKKILESLEALTEIGDSFECPHHCMFIRRINDCGPNKFIVCRRQDSGNYRVWLIDRKQKSIKILDCEYSAIRRGSIASVEKEHPNGSIEAKITIYDEMKRSNVTAIVLVPKGNYEWI